MRVYSGVRIPVEAMGFVFGSQASYGVKAAPIELGRVQAVSNYAPMERVSKSLDLHVHVYPAMVIDRNSSFQMATFFQRD